MNFDEEEVKAVKRKNRQADQIMLNNPDSDVEPDDDDDIVAEKRRTPFKMSTNSDDEHAGSNKKLLNGSDFDIKRSTTPVSNIKLKDADNLEGEIEFDADSIGRMETIDEFCGPTKEEFHRLKRLIDEKDEELKTLEDEFYNKVSSKSVELEGIGPEQEAEIDQHRHLFEMKRLMQLNQRIQ